ncbi:MAG: hypothetical protein IJ991_16170, partial [Thermoguttaceae bacterium]|nr:hypothetical protein [Thermoguttaceae bacterium]
ALFEGQATVENSTFVENEARYGGALAVKAEGALTVVDSRFEANSASECGGALNVDGGATVENSVFSANVSSRGGAIQTGGNPSITLILKSDVFENNSATQGGALYLLATATITDSTFIGNSSEELGGAIRIDAATDVTITDSTISENVASTHGGGVHLTWGTLTLQNVEMTGNETSRDGGAVAIDNANLIVENGEFAGNVAGWGGAIYNYQGTATVENSTFTENSAKEAAGAIRNFEGTLTIVDSTFTNNVATYHAGAVESNATLRVDGSVFTGNKVTSGWADNFGGGAIKIFGGAGYLENSTFTNNEAAGEKSNGGGLLVTDGAEAYVFGSTFAENVAKAGGGIYADGKIVFEGGVLAGNSAGWGGGALAWRELSFANVLVVGNSATQGGGGIYVAGTATIRNATIAGNEAGWGCGLQLHGDRTAALYNTILATNGDEEVSDGGTLIAYNVLSSHTTWDAGAGNYAYDATQPLFNDAANGDYALAPGSQALNKGNDAYSVDSEGKALVADLGGKPRFVGIVDLGAYEAQFTAPNAPNDPSDLVFGAYDQKRKTLFMSWTDNSDDETRFRVEYSVDGGAWKLATTLGANATGRVATGVKANSLYSFRVCAENVYGCSDWVYGNYATTPAAASDLSAVINVSNAPTATLTWTDNALYETGYAIEVLNANDGTWTRVAELPANSTSWTSGTLELGTTYVYNVVAITQTTEKVSEAIFVETGVTPTAPNELKATVNASSAPTATLSWNDNANDETGYCVEVQNADGGWTRVAELTANSTTWTSETLALNTTYVYRVLVANEYGYSVSDSVEAIVGGTPNAPSDFVFGAYDESKKTLRTFWTDNSDDETSFRVEYSVDGGIWKLATILGANATERAATGVKANSLYSFRVRAENAYGVSDWTTAEYATIPAVPTGLTTSAENPNAPTATLTWIDNARYETGYAIEVLDLNEGTWTRIAELPANSTTWTSETLEFNETYIYSVVAINENAEEISEAVVVEIAALPSDLTASVNVSSAPTATLAWGDNASEETSYIIEIQDADGFWREVAELPANSTSWTSEVLDFGATYVYRVAAVNDATSLISASVEIAVGDVPSAPSDLTSTLDVSKSATLVWVDNADSEEGYVVELQGADGSW